MYHRRMTSDSQLPWPQGRVRPVSQPVPKAFEGTGAGKIFANLARMNDGVRHDELRPVVDARIAWLTRERLESAAGECAALLKDVDAFVERFPLYVLARSLGIPCADLDRIFPAARDFARAMAGNADAEAQARGVPAAATLLEAFSSAGGERTFEEVANDAGFMFQGYEAMKALLCKALAAPNRALDDLAFEDPPIPATRRFVGDEAVVVPLQGRPFGAGPHACPGREVAFTIVSLGVRYFHAREGVPKG
jgi:hypothetical protein